VASSTSGGGYACICISSSCGRCWGSVAVQSSIPWVPAAVVVSVVARHVRVELGVNTVFGSVAE
jgi:hypothetical protein